MNKITLFFVFVLMMSSVWAFLAPLEDYGFEEIKTNVVSQKTCQTLSILLNDEDLNKEGVGLLSLNTVFGEMDLDNTYVSVSINEENEQIFWKENFNCKNEECWARIYFPEIKKGTTTLEICLSLGGNTKEATITKKSFIGIYDMPLLKIRNEAPSQIFLGNRAKMSIIVSNEGTDLATIYVQFVHPDTRAKVSISSFDIVEGDSSATTSISPNETKRFDYYIKPSLISSYNLPSAALFFTNVFGEEQVLISNHPTLSVVNSKKLELALILLDSKENSKNFKLIVKNNHSSSFTGEVVLFPQTKIIESTKNIFVSANGEQEILFKTTEFEGSKESFFATIIDGDEIFYSNTIEVENKANSFPLVLFLVIFSIFIGIIIFVWINYSKK